MAFDVKAFLSEVVKDIELDDDSKAAVVKVAETFGSNSEVAKRFEESTMRQSDYSKRMNELRDTQKKVMKYYDDLKNYETSLANNSRTTTPEPDPLPTQQYYDADGNPVQIPTTKFDTSGFVSKEDLDNILNGRIQALETNALGVMTGMQKLSFDHFTKFGEPLPGGGQELLQLAVERGVSLDEAYRQFIEPKLEEKRAQERQAEIAAAKEEAVKEFKAANNFPVSPKQSSVPRAAELLNMETTERPSDKLGWRAAVEAYEAQG